MPDKEAQFEQRLSQVEGLLNQLIRSDRMTFYKHLQILDGRNIQLGQGTGTKIGVAISDRLGFFAQTPTTQPTSASQAALSLDSNVSGGDTVSLADVNSNFAAIQTLVNQLRSDLVTLGLIKGS